MSFGVIWSNTTPDDSKNQMLLAAVGRPGSNKISLIAATGGRIFYNDKHLLIAATSRDALNGPPWHAAGMNDRIADLIRKFVNAVDFRSLERVHGDESPLIVRASAGDLNRPHIRAS